MRLFVAVLLDETIKQGLLDTQEELRRQGVRGNYTSPENMHLTLAFIGEYPDPDPIIDVLTEIDFRKFTLKPDRMGTFGDLWWIGLKENRGMQNLVNELRHRLADAGIPFDKKKFRAHITLIRRAECPKDFHPHSVKVPDVSMQADCISLMQSTRGKKGMIYTELAAVMAE